MVELQLTFRYLWLWLSVLVGLDFGKGRIAIQEVENDEVLVGKGWIAIQEVENDEVLVGKGWIAIQEVENDEVFSSVSLSFTHTLAPTATHAYALEYLPRYHNTEPHSSR